MQIITFLFLTFSNSTFCPQSIWRIKVTAFCVNTDPSAHSMRVTAFCTDSDSRTTATLTVTLSVDRQRSDSRDSIGDSSVRCVCKFSWLKSVTKLDTLILIGSRDVDVSAGEATSGSMDSLKRWIRLFCCRFAGVITARRVCPFFGSDGAYFSAPKTSTSAGQ